MAEPPAKRARRTDSSMMWDKEDERIRSPDAAPSRDRRRSPPPRNDRRDGARDNRRFRSRSRERYDRRRDRSRSGDRRGYRDRKRSVSRDRGSDRRGYAHRDNRGRDSSGTRSPRYEDKMDVDPDADENDMAEEMRRILGFSEFRSTKNTKVPGNNIYGVRKEKKIEYRQYMNRSGGFNRPLSPSR